MRRSILRNSSRLGDCVGSVARPNPITEARTSEWPRNDATLGPSGRFSTVRRQSAGPDQVFFCSSASSTESRGRASTRLNRSATSTVPEYTPEMEQLPTRTVVTPWRTDSPRPGETSSSTS